MATKHSSTGSLESPLLDTSQIVVKIQLKLIYVLEVVFVFLKGQVSTLINQVAQNLNEYFADSILFNTINNCKSYFFNNTVQRSHLLEWLDNKLTPPFTPSNFTTDWRDGIRLCALCEILSPGVCPRYDLLSPSNALNNLKMALNLVQVCFDIKPNVSEAELYACTNENKLVHLLSQIKIAHAKKMIKNTSSVWLKRKHFVTGDTVDGGKEKLQMLLPESIKLFFGRCVVKGMGLICGVRSRRARFGIYYYDPLPKLSLVFEIIGPNESFCSQKVVVEYNLDDDDDDESEEKKLERKSQDHIESLVMRAAMQKKATEKGLKIPFFYKAFSDHIMITYIPLFTGEHIVSIIHQGQHVLNSPYKVSIEESEYLEHEINDIGPKFEPGFQYPMCLLKEFKNRSIEEMGTVVSKKVLKKVVVVNGVEYDYNDYFRSHFNPNFGKLSTDTGISDYKTRNNLNPSNESSSTQSLQNSNTFTNESQICGVTKQQPNTTEPDVPDGGSGGNQQVDLQNSLLTPHNNNIVKHTKFTERKVSFDETNKMKVIERVIEQTKSNLASGEPLTVENWPKLTHIKPIIPEIKIAPPSVDRNLDLPSLTTPSSSGCTSPNSSSSAYSSKTASLKEIMNENSKQFNENMEKLKKSLETNLYRYKAQLEMQAPPNNNNNNN